MEDVEEGLKSVRYYTPLPLACRLLYFCATKYNKGTRSLCTVFKNEAEETFSQQDEGQHLALPFPYPGLFPPIICENQAIGLRLEYCIIGLAITRVWGS